MYHPLDQLYLLLITNKGSNIMEDLDTLRLLGKGNRVAGCVWRDCSAGCVVNDCGRRAVTMTLALVMADSTVVPDQCGGQLTEEKVTERAFNLLFAIDEAITTGGYKESVTLQQIRTNLVSAAQCEHVTTSA